jgi:NitT/TauT family transport system substrate-binding protein
MNALFRRGLLRKTTWTIVLAAMAATGLANAQEANEVRLGHNRAWPNPALILGITDGDFKKAGVKVTERSFDNPADIVQAIATGDLDAGVATTGVLLTALERGVKVKAVANAQGAQTPPVTFMVLADSEIKSVKDIKGKTATISGFAGTTDLMLRYWLEKAGIDPKTDVTIRFLPFHLTLPSLINRQVDVAPLDSALQVIADQKYPSQIRKLFSYADVTESAIGSDHVNAMILVFGTSFIKDHRDTAIRFLEGYLRSIAAIQKDPKKALEDWAAATKFDIIAKLPTPVTLPVDGKIYLDEFRFEAEQAHHFGYVNQVVTPAEAIDSSLIDEAANKIK